MIFSAASSPAWLANFDWSAFLACRSVIRFCEVRPNCDLSSALIFLSVAKSADVLVN